MNDYPSFSPWFRYQREIREGIVIAFVLLFLFLYYILSPLQTAVDKVVTPAVSGITLLYSRVSTPIYRATGVDLGFVNMPPDLDFLYSVRLATYVNERRAAPLLDLAVDRRLSHEKRDRALRAILKFENTAEWVQPFLNELAKGGLLYEGAEPVKETPLVDELIDRIRSEGGVRQTLVRAYAEVAFSFMLQHPNELIRSHALRWLSDVLAEDAVFLVVPRLEKETDPAVRKGIESALYNIRAISDPKEAERLLTPFYKAPPWPSVRRPIGVILARLGNPGAREYVAHALQSEELDSSERAILRVAMAGTPLPRMLHLEEPARAVRDARQKERERQYYAALAKRERLAKADLLKQQMLAARSAEKTPPVQVARVATPVETPPVTSVPPAPEKATPPESASPSTKKFQPEKQETAPPAPEPAPEKTETVTPPKAVARHEKKPPKTFPVAGAGKTAAPPAKAPAASQESTEGVQVVSLPEESSLPPPIEQVPRKPKSVMNYVDMIFEVKDMDIPLYANPGADGATGVILPVGTKGKATFEVLVGEEKWYEVKTKRGNGWANGALLSMYSLSPTGGVPAATKPAGETVPESLNAPERTESTYFEAADEHVTMYDKPGSKGKKLGELVEGTVYLAVKSEKVEHERWFFLKIRSDLNAWVNGIDVQLADVQQPAQAQIPTSDLSQKGKKSAFAAEWVVATVKGVGVYSRPSIAGEMIKQIDPGIVYKVIDGSSGGGNEWYKISLSDKKEGWVQTMDVSLTKPTSK